MWRVPVVEGRLGGYREVGNGDCLDLRWALVRQCRLPGVKVGLVVSAEVAVVVAGEGSDNTAQRRDGRTQMGLAYSRSCFDGERLFQYFGLL